MFEFRNFPVDTVGGKHSYPTRYGYLLASANNWKSQKILRSYVLSFGFYYYNLFSKPIFDLNFKNFKTLIKPQFISLAPYCIDEMKAQL